jgi:hypothetical protein
MRDGQTSGALGLAAADVNAVPKVRPGQRPPTASDRTRSLQVRNWPRSPSHPRKSESCRASMRKSPESAKCLFTAYRQAAVCTVAKLHITRSCCLPPLRTASSHTAQKVSAVPACHSHIVLAAAREFGSIHAKRRLQASYAVRRNGPGCFHTSHPRRLRLQMPDCTLPVVRRATPCRCLANARS